MKCGECAQEIEYGGFVVTYVAMDSRTTTASFCQVCLVSNFDVRAVRRFLRMLDHAGHIQGVLPAFDSAQATRGFRRDPG